MKRVFICLLAALLLFSATACGGNEAETELLRQDTAAVEETEPAETSRADTKDGLPEGLDYDGLQINFIIRPEFQLYDTIGESGGDIVYDAVYNRNLAVEERLNVALNYMATADNDFNTMAKQVANSIIAGTDEYDVVMQRGLQTFSQTLDGYYRNLNDAPYIDMTKPWWWMNIVNDTNVNPEKVFFLTGDMSISTFLLSTVCFVNKQMLDNYGKDISTLYDTVEEGKWTYDVFEEYIQDVYMDTNGDGSADENDTYAFSYLAYGAQWFNYSSGIKFIERDTDGYPILTLNNEKTMHLLETLVHIWWDNNYGYLEPTGDYTAMVRKFMDEENLFCMGRFMHTDLLRDFEQPYGVIPYPKLDESYDYMSGTGCSGNFISIPTTCADFEPTCAVLEALSAENYRKVFPTYYESALKIKYVSENRDAQMIDIVHDSIYVDFLLISGMNNVIDGLLQNKSTDFASAYAAQINSMEEALADIIDRFNKLP